ncbi:MAG TPA: hypothetical protein ENH48_10970 [Halieaceae bacterium]|nr:MAG: hypothetical protein DRQ98_02765 [Gammaproteobacteria bacterium]HDY83459.1 hypothetical protein [Halieaceae bacterium]
MKAGIGRFFRHAHWAVESETLDVTERTTFQSMDTLLQSPMEQVTLDSRSGVSTLTLQSVYYVKTFKGPGIRHWLGTSRYQRELRNLQYFNKLGLGTPRLVAYGHQTKWGVPEKAVIVTAEVERATDLEKIIEAGALYSGGVAGVRKVLDQLARAVRVLHGHGFYHKDLKTRNILLRQAFPASSSSGNNEPELFFFDCPSGHHPPRFMFRRSIVRDLAHLEEGLRGHIRKVDLLYLFKQYRGCDKLSPEDKALARDVLSYHTQRRMTRKRRLRAERKKASSQH